MRRGTQATRRKVLPWLACTAVVLLLAALLQTTSCIFQTDTPNPKVTYTTTKTITSTPTTTSSTKTESPIPTTSTVTPSHTTTVTPQTRTLILPESIKISVGDTGKLEIQISGLENGLSGYDLTVILQNNGTAIFTDVFLPDIGLTDYLAYSDIQVEIKGVDVKEQLQSGNGQGVLGTFEIQGKSTGFCTVTVIVNALDDDYGNPVEPSINPGTIEIIEPINEIQ